MSSHLYLYLENWKNKTKHSWKNTLHEMVKKINKKKKQIIQGKKIC